MAGGFALMNKPTPNGFNSYDLMSALQKFIRRGMEEEALYVFYELEAAGLYNLAANRLCIIVYEDVGIENRLLLNSIQGHMDQMAKWYKQNNGAWRLVLGNIILQACRGKRTRMADYFVSAVAFKRVNGYVLDLDEHDFVFDKHTRKGKSMGRGREHFFEEAVKIEYPESFKTEEDYRNEEIENIDDAYANGNAWDLYRQDNRQSGKQGQMDFGDLEDE